MNRNGRLIGYLGFGMVGVSTLLCALGFLVVWFLQHNTLSPAQTALGTEPFFDDTLFKANQEWSFIFENNNRNVAIDVYGESEGVVFDIAKATQDQTAELFRRSVPSPDGRYLAVPFSSWGGSSGLRSDRLIVVDISSGEFMDIPTLLEGFEFDWDKPAFWISSDVLLVSMHRYPGEDPDSEEITFLRYDIRGIEPPQTIEFDPCVIETLIKPDSNVLLLASMCDSPLDRPIYAVDTKGKRLATPDEIRYFNLYYVDCFGHLQCVQHLSDDFPVVRTDYFYENNRFRDKIYLDEQLVRVTDWGLSVEPIWDSDLQMFIWQEGDSPFLTYQMDSQGHYRLWYGGFYRGKILKIGASGLTPAADWASP